MPFYQKRGKTPQKKHMDLCNCFLMSHDDS